MSDRVAVLREGRLEQIGRPVDLYETPGTEFVADFIGSANLLRGELDSDGTIFSSNGLRLRALTGIEPNPGPYTNEWSGSEAYEEK